MSIKGRHEGFCGDGNGDGILTGSVPTFQDAGTVL